MLTRRRFLAVAIAAVLAGCSSDPVIVTGDADPRLALIDRVMQRFVREHDAPGASLAITRNGKLVYARGFGYADTETKEPVEPDSLFRIASVTKPFTAVAVLQLVEAKKLSLDDHVVELLGIAPTDPRWREITIRQLLQHRAGFDREKSFDPLFDGREIAVALHAPPPAAPDVIIRYMLGWRLDFAPGTRMAYSNFGYTLLGRVIEKVSGETYAAYVAAHILTPAAIHDMHLGRTALEERAHGEVHYYDHPWRHAKSVFDPAHEVPLPYGAWSLEGMDSNGGWIASAPALLRFARTFDDPAHSTLLGASSIETMWAPPDGETTSRYYACGWNVISLGAGKIAAWHTGGLDGTSTLLARGADGIDFAVLFNARRDRSGKELADLVGPLVTAAISATTSWPDRDLFLSR